LSISESLWAKLAEGQFLFNRRAKIVQRKLAVSEGEGQFKTKVNFMKE
jgi:hypothetical protein